MEHLHDAVSGDLVQLEWQEDLKTSAQRVEQLVGMEQKNRDEIAVICPQLSCHMSAS